MNHYYPDEVSFNRVARTNTITTLSDLKKALRVNDTDDDSFLNIAMSQAKLWIERYLDRRLDNCEYELRFSLSNARLCEHDRIILFDVAPISGVTLDGDAVTLKTTPDGFNKYIAVGEDTSKWEEDFTLVVTTSWGADLLNTIIKPAFYTTCARFRHQREFNWGGNFADRNVITNTLYNYKRKARKKIPTLLGAYE